jgi:D-arginine utilization repressor
MPPGHDPTDLIAKAITALFHPHVEVVLHDLDAGRISHVWNPTSGRRIGDESMIDAEFRGATHSGVIGPYEQVDIRGHRTSSVSVLLAEGRLLCINFDRSVVDGAIAALTSLATPRIDPPRALFANDWRARINQAIADWCTTHNLVARDLDRRARLDLVTHLERDKFFETKHAAEHIATALGVSRATVYNLRKESQQ